MAVAENFVEAPDIAAPPEAPTAAHGELRPPVGVKFAYAFGQMIESGYLVVASFVFFYYTAVLGLSGTLVGTALAISMCLDALMDPLIGSISDNVRSRLGRRLPLMLIACPFVVLMLGMLFAPPAGLAPFLLFGWLVLAKMGLRGAASLYNLPYAALGAEMADGYVERASVVAYRAVAGIVIGVLITGLAYGYFFAGKGGLQVRDHYPAFGWSVAVLMVAGAAICCAGVWRYARRLPQPTTPPSPMLLGLFRELPEVFRNASFRTLFVSAVMFWVAAGVNGAFNNYAYVFVWKVRPERIQLISYAYFGGILFGVPVARALLNRLEKKTVILQGLALVLVCFLTLQVLRATGLFMLSGDAALPWLSGNAAIIGLGVGLLSVAYPAMMADAADEHEVLFGARREGLYFAGLGFAAKAASGLGQMAAGFALDALHFPKAAGGHAGAVVAEPVLRLLVLAWGPLAAIFAFAGAIALLPYAITRLRHHDIAAQVKTRRAAELSAARSS
ncbi:MAG: MFS transporter [Caulobacterales bacterium]|nr:MFS transporter [Caulobacterales bacterium]